MMRRSMGTIGGLMLTLAALSPSLGVFVVGNDMLHEAGSGTIACLGAAVLLGVAMAAVYAELGSAFPHAGAEYAVAGRVLGPKAGFAMLAMNVIGLPLGMAISALGLGAYLQDLLPSIGARTVALAAVLAAVLIGACSIRMNARLTLVLVAAEVSALVVTALTGMAHLQPDALARLIHPTMADGPGAVRAVPLSMLAVTAAAAVYALNGYGGVLCFSEEITEPHRKVGRVIFAALGIAAVVIIVPLAAVVGAAPDLAALYRAGAPIAGFLGHYAGRGVELAVSLSVAGAIFNCMIAIALTFGRVIYAAARDEAWPDRMNLVLGTLSARFGSPANATLGLGALTVPLCFLPLKLLILMSGNGALAIYATLALCALAGRRNGATACSKARAALHPLAPCVVLAAVTAMAVADLRDGPGGWAALLAPVASMALGVGYAIHVAQERPGWTLRGPAELAAGDD